LGPRIRPLWLKVLKKPGEEKKLGAKVGAKIGASELV